MKFNKPFYVLDLIPDTKDPKSLKLKNWNNTDIEPTERFLIIKDYYELDHFAEFTPRTWEKCACFEMLSQKVTDNDLIDNDYTIGFCCLDIDDQRLNPKSEYYDLSLDANYIKRLETSGALTNAILSEFKMMYGTLDYTPFYIWQSNKGFHIITKLPPKYYRYLGQKKLHFADEFLKRYNLENLRNYLDIDLLQQHQIKKPGEKCKPVLTLQSKGNVKTLSDAINEVQNNPKGYELPDICVPKPKIEKPIFREFNDNDRNELNKYHFVKLLNYLGIVIKYRSGNEIKICCPFHDEKTASCCIDIEKGLYHCFGCGAEGNIYQFYAGYKGYDTKRDYLIIKSELDQIAQ